METDENEQEGGRAVSIARRRGLCCQPADSSLLLRSPRIFIIDHFLRIVAFSNGPRQIAKSKDLTCRAASRASRDACIVLTFVDSDSRGTIFYLEYQSLVPRVIDVLPDTPYFLPGERVLFFYCSRPQREPRGKTACPIAVIRLFFSPLVPGWRSSIACAGSENISMLAWHHQATRICQRGAYLLPDPVLPLNDPGNLTHALFFSASAVEE